MGGTLKALHEQYDGKMGAAFFRIAECLVIAAIIGVVTLFGTSARMNGVLERVVVQLSSIETKLDAHVSNYSIHRVPSAPHTDKAK